MLSFFQIEKSFGKTVVKLYVDVHRKEAEMTVLHGRRIRRMEKVAVDQCIEKFGQTSYVRLTDVDGAEAYLSKDMGERGSLVEYLDWACAREVI